MLSESTIMANGKYAILLLCIATMHLCLKIQLILIINYLIEDTKILSIKSTFGYIATAALEFLF